MSDTTTSDTSVSDTDSACNGATTDSMPHLMPHLANVMVNGFTLSDPDSGHDDVHVSVETTASATVLWQCWQDMSDDVETAGRAMTDAGHRWTQATTQATAWPVEQRLWADYESISRNFRVLSAWRDVLYAAWVFATDGVALATRDIAAPPAPQSGPREF